MKLITALFSKQQFSKQQCGKYDMKDVANIRAVNSKRAALIKEVTSEER